MTNREFYTNISNGIVNDEVIAHAKAAIEKMDTANANRKSKPSKTAKENEPIKASIVELLTTNGAMVASAIGTALTTPELEISTSKVSALCRQLVEAKVLSVEDVKIPKKGTVKQYSIATTPSAE